MIIQNQVFYPPPQKKTGAKILHSGSGDVTEECMSLTQGKEEMRMHVSMQTFLSTPTVPDYVLDDNLYMQRIMTFKF